MMSARSGGRTDPLDSVWRALADPTRRRILDLLRQAPRTTGALAEEFPISRFAVMKHLQLLLEAGLVAVRRSGRERWNHLNPLPLQRLYERWVTPWERSWNDRLEGLRVEAERGREKMMSEASTAFRTVAIDMEIEAPVQRVWGALLGEIGSWWPRDFHIGGAGSRMTLEAAPGGRLFETWGEGAGLLWAQVIAIDPQRSIQFAGHLAPEFGGPATSIWKVALTELPQGTKVKLTDAVFGRVGDELHGSLEEGWRQIVAGLKAHAEGTPLPRARS